MPNENVNIVQATQFCKILEIGRIIHFSFRNVSKYYNILNVIYILESGLNKGVVFLLPKEPVKHYELVLVFKDLFQFDKLKKHNSVISKFFINYISKIFSYRFRESEPVPTIQNKRLKTILSSL